MSAHDDDDDLPNIRQHLADRATELFEHLYDKPQKRGRNEWRWGRKGSLVLYLRGRAGPHWKCYESGDRGDMLAAIRHALGTDFVGALDWARSYLGLPLHDRQRRHRTEPPPKQKKPAADYDAEQAGKARRAAELSAAAGPIARTLAERYLREHRGIEAETWPDALGFTDAATIKHCTGWQWWRWPALLVRATDAAGIVTGLQLIALRADGSAAKHWEHDGKLKLSFGTIGGAAVRLPGDDRALLLAEGPETALSCWHATGIETWCNLGSIVRAPLASVPLNRLIVVCADDDARDAQSNKALRDAIRGWRREGRRVVQVKPNALTKRDKSDFNDTLRAEGREAVRDRIMTAIEDQPAERDLPSGTEARQRAEELIEAAIDDLLIPDPFARLAAETLGKDAASFLALRLATGIGKTRIAIRRGVREAAGGRKIIYLVPTHKLGAELVGRIEAEARQQGVNVTVDVWRGRRQERPDDPDKTMCSELSTIALAQAAKVDPADVCAICPAREECPYLAQQGRTAQIWIAAHDLLWHAMPGPLKDADLVVIDEDFATRGLIGLSGRPGLLTEAELGKAPDEDALHRDAAARDSRHARSRRQQKTVSQGHGPALEADIRQQPMRKRLIPVLRDHPDGGLRRDRLIAAGLTVEDAVSARKLEWASKIEVDIAGMSWRRAKQAIERAFADNELIPRFAALWHAVEDLLIEDGPPTSGRATIGDHKSEDVTFRVVRLYGAERIASGWQRIPTLNIDATVDMTLLRYRVPHAELVGKVEAAAPHMRIVQYPDRAFGKTALQNERLLFKVWSWCVAYAARRGGEWGVVLPKEAQTAIIAAREVPSFIRLHHFGALRGLDKLKGVRGLIVVGRPMARPAEVERIAGALSGRAVDPVAGDWYPAETVQIRARDGSVATVEADRHPDPLAEAVRASIAEGELLQSIGRARGVNRSEADPVEIVLLGNVPVPGLPIDELRQWDGPTIDDEIFARFGVVLESAGDAATVTGLKRDAVRVARQRLGTFPYKYLLYENVLNLPQPNLCKATYQLAGPGRSRQGVVYDRRRIADCQTWLTERLGPLAYFAEAEAEPAADLCAEPEATADAEPATPEIARPVLPIWLSAEHITPAAPAPVATPRPRTCEWFVDTTGDTFRRCGEAIHDGRDYCPTHRARHAALVIGEPVRPPMPFGPFPTGYAVRVMAAE